MGLIIKDIIALWVMPLNFIVLVIGVGLLLLWLSKYQKTGKILVTISAVLLIPLSMSQVSNSLLWQLEQQYPYFNLEQPVDVVMVLGHSANSNSYIPLSSQLSYPAQARLVEGVRILNENPESMLVVSGFFGGFGPDSNAEIYRQVALSMGVNDKRIVKFEQPKNTREEAQALAEIVGDKSVALVTSASHMPRAMMLFKQQKLDPIAAPTDFSASPPGWHGFDVNIRGLYRSTKALHEYIGIIWGNIADS